MHLLTQSPAWFPYFGNQKRFTPFVLELLQGLGARPGQTFYETNAGSHAISYAVATQLGLKPTANDLGAYSCAIGRALCGDTKAAATAALGAALIETHGYNPPADASVDHERVAAWLDFIYLQPKVMEANYQVTRGNLFENMLSATGDFIYCDFAWPWRDGSYTAEYETTADTLGSLLGDEVACTFQVASARRILEDVVCFLDEAQHRFKFIILSNQSSNYPTPEVLETHMRACGHVPIVSRRQTVPAEYVDDLGKDTEFTEFQYVFKGR
jgi:hypothetical protein